MAKILFVGDVHLSDRPPLGRVEGYREQILAKMVEVGEISAREEVDATVFLGDIFHSKRPMFTSHYLVQQVQAVFSRYFGAIMIVPGNHDQGPEGIESLQRQPLGVLNEQAAILLAGNTNRMGKGEAGSIISRPYDANRDLDPAYYALTDEEKQLPAPRIVVAHGSLVPKDDPNWAAEYHHYALPVEDIDTEGIDLLVSGHIHEPFGPITLNNGTIFFNPGSISRTSRKAVNFERVPKVVLCSTDLIAPGQQRTSFNHIPLESVLPAAEVFLAPEEGGGVVTDEIRDFADSLAGGLALEDVSMDEMLVGLKGVSDGAKVIIKEELEEAGV